MFYKSTRNSGVSISSAEAIVQGISADGGLFVPSEIPQMSMDEIVKLGDMSYAERAAVVFSKFLTDFTDAELKYCTESAYNDKNFASADIAEISHLFDGTYVLELWHGPTCAFKVFYPQDGVSAMQKRQMATQDGNNVTVCALNGNFDDCQNGVKAIFTNEEIKQKLADGGMMFSSANSINWGRLAPQIIYYISTYAELVKDEQIKAGDKINIVVPTGNFGNILAAYYAKHMGMPVNKLICASNANNVLTDFINTGIYDRNRKFITTVSPSMDILISSNLERLLYILCGENDAQIREWFGKLASEGRYEVNDDVKAKLKADFAAGFCDDAQTKAVIKEIYDKYSYTLDTHTAVAVKVYEDYKKATGDNTKTVIASTASPYKFSTAVLEAIEGKVSDMDEFDKVERLHEVSGYDVPKSLAELKNKPIRFTGAIGRDEMKDFVLKSLSL